MTLSTPRQTKSGQERKGLSPEQLLTMRGVFDLRERVIACPAKWEGMRPSEVLALQFGVVEADCVWVRRRVYRGELDVPKVAPVK